MNNFGIKREKPHFMYLTAGGSAITASTTAYAPLNGTGNFNATESNRQILIGTACRLSNLSLRTLTTQSGTGDLVLTVRKNGVDTALTITITAGSAAGLFSDSTNSVAFAAGDLLSISGANAATTGSATIIAFNLKIN